VISSPERGDFLREKGCVSCHDPHQSDRRFLLRQKT
jgi:predicted CXXCH cytochrome family protein